MRSMTILAPEGMLGYGIPARSLEEGLKRDPAALAVDAGSTDPGPYYLGAGVPFTNRRAVKRDLTMMLEAAVERRIPALVGSAGGSGGRPHLEWMLDVYREIARERKWRLRTAAIPADVDPAWLKARIADGKVRPLDLTTPLTADEVDRSVRIVAQMGLAPLVRALELDVDVVIAGRACDAAVIGAVPIRAGFDPALVIHMGKILECGGAAAYPRHGSDSLLGTVDDESFTVEPPNPDKVCTVASVAAHSLYERADPYVLHLPEGAIDLRRTRFEQATPRAVRVTGTRFVAAERCTLKLEGVRRVGARTITVAGVRDPILVSQLDPWLANVRERVEDVYGTAGYRLLFHVYGRNGVMGPLEPLKQTQAHELGVVIEVVADDAESSAAILALARSAALHATYPGRKAIAGNLAFPFSPSDLRAGEVYEFNVHHLVEVDDPLELFPIKVFET
ncbi:MAG: acyclic terpene utilization AtuA family protein [Candidatus Rokubacteria bacterium]|nr:acyclic terpene utilization AtuA family protein [Candidatus Rokubacteria bacterium]